MSWRRKVSSYAVNTLIAQLSDPKYQPPLLVKRAESREIRGTLNGETANRPQNPTGGSGNFTKSGYQYAQPIIAVPPGAPEIMPKKIAEILEKTVLSDGFFPLVRYRVRHSLFAGGMSRPFEREILLRDQVAAVLPYDPDRDAVVLIEQFRAGKFAAGAADPWMIEIVAGIIEDGETPEVMARREAVEEAGCQLGVMEALPGFYPSAGGCSEYTHMFCGRVDSRGVGGIHGLDDEDEDIRVIVEPTDRALERLARGGIDNAITVVALQWLALNRARLRAQWT